MEPSDKEQLEKVYNEVLEIKKTIEFRFKRFESQSINQKKILTLKEACIFLDLSKHYLYKLTSSGRISFFIPNGKKIFFLREDLEQYLLKTRVKSYDEHDADADTFLNNKKLVR